MPLGRTLLAFTVVSLLAYGSSAQDSAGEVLARAERFYETQNYDSTAAVIRAYLKKHGKDPQTEFLVPLLMESLVRKNDLRYFERLLKIYEQKFAQSDFMPRLLYLEGIALARQDNHQDAVVAFSRALKSGVRPPLDSLALRNVKLICEEALAEAELGRLSARGDLEPRVAEIVAYYEFTKLYAADKVDRARQKAEQFRKQFPSSPYGPFARDIIKGSRFVQKKQIAIGLLAPVSGYDADVGRQVVQAVQLAVDQYNESTSSPVRLIIGDTEGKMLRTAQLTHEMINVHKVPVIIGPVLSPNAIVAGAMLIEKEIVMVTPTATDDGIARLGPGIFQLNVTAGMLGRRIAAYAMQNLNIRDFAIISPLTDYGRTLSASFRKEVEARGGEIVDEEMFDEGTNDFRQQFERLRARLLARRQEKTALEKGMEYSQAHSSKTSRADSIYYADTTMAVGGLFLPAESEDVVMLAPQVHFHRIQTQLLGSTGWHTSTTLLDGKRYVNDAIISTSFETEAKDEQWVSFSAAYKARFDMEPDRVAAPLAYDAARLVLGTIERCGDEAKAIARMLHQVRNYQGVSGAITFDETEGANTETAIVKIKDKKFIRIQ